MSKKKKDEQDGAGGDAGGQEGAPEAKAPADPHKAQRAKVEDAKAKAADAREKAEKAVKDAEAAEHALAVATSKPSRLPESESGWYVVLKDFHGTSPHMQRHGVGAVHLVKGQRVHRKYHPLEHWVGSGLQVEAA